MKWLILGAGRSGLGALKLLRFHKQEVYLFDEKISSLNDTFLTTNLIQKKDHPIFFEKEFEICC